MQCCSVFWLDTVSNSCDTVLSTASSLYREGVRGGKEERGRGGRGGGKGEEGRGER